MSFSLKTFFLHFYLDKPIAKTMLVYYVLEQRCKLTGSSYEDSEVRISVLSRIFLLNR